MRFAASILRALRSERRATKWQGSTDSARERHSLFRSGAFGAARIGCPSIQFREWYCPQARIAGHLTFHVLVRFRGHCGFLLAPFALSSSVTCLLHTVPRWADGSLLSPASAPWASAGFGWWRRDVVAGFRSGPYRIRVKLDRVGRAGPSIDVRNTANTDRKFNTSVSVALCATSGGLDWISRERLLGAPVVIAAST